MWAHGDAGEGLAKLVGIRGPSVAADMGTPSASSGQASAASLIAREKRGRIGATCPQNENALAMNVP